MMWGICVRILICYQCIVNGPEHDAILFGFCHYLDMMRAIDGI